ncbi:MAG: hypothetical protein IJX63_15345 [Lachnospiraceae bacterium]|nr:hypothetical protein [Lachnospiraceae bacterium]
MEIIILIMIVLVYCLVLDVDLNYIFLGGIALIGIFSVLLTFGFLFCNVCLLFSKRKEAKFTRIDYAKNSKLQVAYYLVEGKEYPCMFPKEGIMEERLYNKNKTYHVRLNVKLGKVFDRFAVATCVLGFVFGLSLCVGFLFLYWGG